jgi:hypothetical protein
MEFYDKPKHHLFIPAPGKRVGNCPQDAYLSHGTPVIADKTISVSSELYGTKSETKKVSNDFRTFL